MILVVLKCLFILVCRSKSPTGLMLYVVQYSTQNKISMSMSNFYVYANACYSDRAYARFLNIFWQYDL